MKPTPMKVGFILDPSTYISNVVSGVVVQARAWRGALLQLGHEVEFIPPARAVDWDSFDIIHLFQHGAWALPLLEGLQGKSVKIAFSPIIDPPRPYGWAKTAFSLVPVERLKLLQNQRLLRLYGRISDAFMSRSQLEAASLRSVGVPPEKLFTVPIGMSINTEIDDETVRTHARNGAVLHVSHLCHRRKNVRRLVKAAAASGFQLRLAGSISDQDFAQWLRSIVERYPNIVYLGRLPDARLVEEMLSCRVFCLPSRYEGVGLVALDAAYCGANPVVTTRGGTSDYFGDLADYVDPDSTSSIVRGIESGLSRPAPNMPLRTFAERRFSPLVSAGKLADAYRKVLA